MAATSSIRNFWQRLQGSVHPDDKPILDSYPDVFNRQFPPPAFIGDVDNAPVVILMGNGGYNPETTPLEFRSSGDHDEYIRWLKGQRLDPPKNLSTYYTRNALFPLVRERKVAYVNAVAYREKKITKEVRLVAKELPSTRLHKSWMRHELFPAASNGDRLVIVHRCSLWDIKSKREAPIANIHFSKCAASPYLDREARLKIESFLLKRQN